MSSRQFLLLYYSPFIVCFFQTYGTHEPYCCPINNVLFNRGE
nr:MAG TPA: Protein of unknown function (DUF4448) [Caudoviricetes sp.]